MESEQPHLLLAKQLADLFASLPNVEAVALGGSCASRAGISDIALNHPVLRSVIPAYARQLEKAVKRSDLVSINHRLAALFTSYFDIIFAVNRQLHPGEKRIVESALSNCKSLPADMETDVRSILTMTAANVPGLPARLARLLDRLDQLLESEGFANKPPG